MLLVPAAAALTLEATSTWPAPEGSVAVAIQTGFVVTTGAAGTTVAWPGGVVYTDAETTGVALAMVHNVLWVCGEGGLFRAEPDEDPSRISSEPCVAIAPMDNRVLFAGATVSTLNREGDAAPTDLVVAGTPLLAASDDEPAAAAVGDTVVQIEGSAGVYTRPTSGPVGGLVWFGERWTWSLPETAEIERADGQRWPVDAAPGRLLRAEVDGDFVDDLVVLHAGEVGVVLGSDLSEIGYAGTFDTFAVGDVDDDRCAEVVVLGGGMVTVIEAACGWDVDVDGDGMTPAEGDCDDDEYDIHPTASEICDGRDDDCDGETDYYASGWLTPVSGTEGDHVRVPLDGLPCAEWFDFAAAGDGRPPVRCSAVDAVLDCVLLDDGAGEIQIDVTDGEGVVVRESAPLTVANAPPTLAGMTGGGCGAAPFETADVVVDVGEHVQRAFAATDAPYDTIAWSIVNGPPGLSIAPDGAIDWIVGPADVGEWTATLVVDDEDGGRTTRDYHLTVGGGCGCTTARPSAAALLGVLVVLRRRSAAQVVRSGSAPSSAPSTRPAPGARRPARPPRPPRS